MKKIYLLLMVSLFVTVTQATNVIPPETAKVVAKNFMSERTVDNSLALSDFMLDKTVQDDEGNPLYYVFNMPGGGFVFVSATDRISPVIAFSLGSNYEGNETSRYLESKFKAQIQEVQAMPSLADPKAATAWKRYANTHFKVETAKAEIGPHVEPLVTTLWNQNKFFNQYCPYNAAAGSGFDYRVPNGCVALTVSNLLNYYRYPSHGISGVSYRPPVDDPEGSEPVDYGRLTASFTGLYDYNYITDEVSDYQGYLGKLTSHTGISVRMAYGVDGSGSNGDYALNALKTNWGYSPAANLKQKAAYASYDDWADSVIIKELEEYRPVYYAGYSANYGQGHAWIVDGYVTIDTMKYFHVNWGWGGADNGFYKIDLLNTSSYGSFSSEESVIVNLVDSVLMQTMAKPATSSDTLYGNQGSICDGAGNQKYQPNSNRKWLISAPHATSYTFNFRKIKVQEGDEIIIYNGATEASGVRQRYTGDYLSRACFDNSPMANSFFIDFDGEQLPSNLTVAAPEVLVVFTSDGDSLTTGYGFNINYKATVSRDDNACTDNYMPSYDATAIISNKVDTAQEGDYHAHAQCGWRINCTFVTGYVFTFNKFDLGAGDFVDIFDNSNASSPQLLHRFDVDNNLPGHVYSIAPANGRLLIKFASDNVYEGEGFELVYHAILGVEDREAFENLNVYPNPAHTFFTVDCTTGQAEELLLQLTDLTGRVVYSEKAEHAGGTSSHRIPVENLSNGIYLLKIQSSQGTATRKVVVN